jgi:hypothetical protein
MITFIISFLVHCLFPSLSHAIEIKQGEIVLLEGYRYG